MPPFTGVQELVGLDEKQPMPARLVPNVPAAPIVVCERNARPSSITGQAARVRQRHDRVNVRVVAAACCEIITALAPSSFRLGIVKVDCGSQRTAAFDVAPGWQSGGGRIGRWHCGESEGRDQHAGARAGRGPSSDRRSAAEQEATARAYRPQASPNSPFRDA